METLEELKAIIDNAPEGAKSISEHVNAYVKRHDGNFYWWDGECWQKLHCHIETRSLSDIEQIIELMEMVEDAAALGFLTPGFDSGVSHKQLCKKYETMKL